MIFHLLFLSFETQKTTFNEIQVCLTGSVCTGENELLDSSVFIVLCILYFSLAILAGSIESESDNHREYFAAAMTFNRKFIVQLSK